MVSKALVKTLDLQAAYFLSCLLDWSSDADKDGFFGKTANDCTEEIGLSRYLITEARYTLEDAGILETSRRGSQKKHAVHYRLNKEAINNQCCIAKTQPRTPRPKSGWIYVLKCQDRYKIGRAVTLTGAFHILQH